MYTISQKRQVNKTLTGVNHSSYSAAEVSEGAELYYDLNDPATLPARRATAEAWFCKVFLHSPREYRTLIRERYAFLCNQRDY